MLSTFLLEPIRWIDTFCWRKLCTTERLGYYYFWRGVGKAMNIDDIPPSLEEFEAWAAEYERVHFRFSESNRRVGTATRDLFASWFPRFTAPLVNYSIYALLDDAMIEAFGFPKPIPGTRPALRGALKLRGRLVRWLPTRRPSLEEFEAWAAEYERVHFRFSESNRRVGTATRDLFASWFPRFTAPLVNYSIYALLDDAMIEAFGFPKPKASIMGLRGRAG